MEKQNRKKYLVTGGAGFIGSAITKKLVERGNKVRVLDNNFRGAETKLKEVLSRIEFIKTDIRDADKVKKAAKGVNAIIHLAFIQGTENFYKMPEIVLEVGVKGMINILDACRRWNIKELILASSSEVYQTPPKIPTPETVPLIVPDVLNPRYSYGGGKIISELMALNYGRKFFDKVVVFRPHNIYGPNMGWEHVVPQFITKMQKIIKKNPDKKILPFPIQGTGKETRAFCYIDDFVEGLLLLLKKGEHLNIYNIGNPEEITAKKLAEKIATCFGKKIKIIPGKLMPGSTTRRCPDISKLIELGYKPKINLDKGLKQTIEWYNRHKTNDNR